MIASRTGPPAFAEFAVQSNFSFLRGASHPEELVVTAKRLGLAALGLADRNTVSGVVRAHQAAKEAGLAYHPGARLVFSDSPFEILAYPKTRHGWAHLCRMLTTANLRGEKGAPDLLVADLLDWGEALELAVIWQPACNAEDSIALLKKLVLCLGDTVRLAAAPTYGPADHFSLEMAAATANKAGVPLMAINDVLCHGPERRKLHDVVTAIRLHAPVYEAGCDLLPNAERHLKEPVEMARLFSGHERALAETQNFAGKLCFSLDELKYNYPKECFGEGTPQQELERLAWLGATERYGDIVPEKIKRQIRHELALIEELEYAPYFLTVHDIVHFARSQDILCQGRGSAANSTICYCIGITAVDPAMADLLFERFISPERREPPDIDVDFEHERREEVIQYIYEKYGRDRTGLAATVITYRSRSAMREVAKAMGLSEDVMSALSGSIWGWSASDLGEREAKAAGLDMADAATRHTLALATEISGFPRHLSQHVGGFVITEDRLDEVVPITKTAMEGRTMVEWDKDDLDALGMLKIDILALGMLTCLARAFKMLESHYQQPMTLASMPKEQVEVYDMICRADTLGVFQIESRAQMSMLPRLKPRKFYDLVIEVAIVRPGPIQGDMVHPYLRRRQGIEPVSYPSKALEQVLGKTMGVPLFQEQAMQISIVAAGFAPGEADRLRRAMATFRRVGTIHTFQQKMIDGMVSNGYEKEYAERCFRQIEGFGEYGFPESHAASFALLVYASCWLKCFYPDVFCAAMLNSQPMGFYAPAQLVRDAREHGVEVRPADINLSTWDSLLEPVDFDRGAVAKRHCSMKRTIRSHHAVRLGFRQIKGFGEEDADKLVAARGTGYDSVRDLWLRSGLEVHAIARLAEADAFRSLGLDRRAALWAVQALGAKTAAERLPLFDLPDGKLRDNEPDVSLPPMPLGEHVIHDYRYLSLSLKAHPVSFLRNNLASRGVIANERLPEIANGRRVSVAGLVLVRQRPGSAKGVIFMTLEDETSIANIIVWPKTFERFRPLILGSRFVRVRGKLQCESNVIHIVADTIEDLTPLLAELSEKIPVIDSLANADEVRRPVADMGKRITPRSRLIRLMREQPDLKGDYARLANSTGKVMPKGRNFH
ncbi:MAG: error-prone DNA polymerase [Hyphomicrobiales bacterium]|nr:error-prone DNA polymerase [Hyphomicrobiales bacterium]